MRARAPPRSPLTRRYKYFRALVADAATRVGAGTAGPGTTGPGTVATGSAAMTVAANGRLTARRQVRPVLHEPADVVGLASAIGEHHRDIRDDDRAHRGDGRHPAQMVDEHEHRGREAERPDGHHDQVPVLAVPDVLGHGPARLGNQVHLLTVSWMMTYS